MTPSDRSLTFTLLLPVKAWARAKTRLRSDSAAAGGLPAAFALDVLAAASESPRVTHSYVVTAQTDFQPPGAEVLPDEGGGDLNAALRAAATRVRGLWPGSGLAVLLADLPCLRPRDLTEALGRGDAGRWFVADAPGTGTTLLAAAPGIDLDPHFGEGSAARHRSSGAIEVTGDLASLRLDVDTAEDLARAGELGVGRYTAAIITPGAQRWRRPTGRRHR